MTLKIIGKKLAILDLNEKWPLETLHMHVHVLPVFQIFIYSNSQSDNKPTTDYKKKQRDTAITPEPGLTLVQHFF